MKRLTLLLTCLFCCMGLLVAQTTKVTGTVLDDKGEAVIGAVIKIKGNTNKGTTTDFDGKFELDVPTNFKTLIVSYTGMKAQEVAIKPVMSIKLDVDAQQLDEVIVTGYQKIDRKMFTGAASVVKAEDAKVDGVTDVSRMLQGKAAGVQLTNVSGTFGAAPKLRVRGASSIYGNSSPLWVVDGVVLDDVVDVSADDLSSGNAATLISSAVAGLNADDIETFQILKDASATSLYGARAMNGVIVITTKKGRAGSATINYTGEFSIRAKPYYGQYDILNSQDQMSVFLEMQDKGSLNPSTMYLAKDGGVFNLMYRLIDEKANGGYGLDNTTQAKLAYLKEAELRNTNWFDELFRYSIQQNHSISISSGTDKARTYTSMSYFNDPGWTAVDKVDRFTFNTNTLFDITKKLTFGVLANASIRNQKAPGTLNSVVNVVEGEYSRDFDINPFSYALNTSRTMASDVYYRRNYAAFNIQNELENNYLDLDMLDTKMQLNLTYKPVKGLDIDLLGAYRYVKTTREHNILDGSNMAMAYRANESTIINSNNNFLWGNPDDPDALPIVVMRDGGMYNTQDNNLMNYYGRAQANYNKIINGKHALNLLGGAEIRSTDRSDRWNNGYGFLYGSEIAVTDWRIMRKVIDSGSAYYGLTKKFDRSAGFFGAGTYSYDGRYTINGTLRTEGTNQMGKTNTARWLPTWNISGSWNAKNESFLKDFEPISAMTFRGTYGLTAKMISGANALSVLQASQTYRPFQEDRETMLEIINVANENLTWEKMKETNLGLDLGLFQNRVSLGFDAYWRNSYDLLGNVRTSGIGGEHIKFANYADMKSSGLEFSINTVNLDRKDFSWSNHLTFSFNKNEITNLNTTSRVIDLVGLSGAPKEGSAVRGLFSVPFAGLDSEGLPTFYNENGERVYYIDLQNSTSTDYLKYEGSIDPKIVGGFENSIKYKNMKLDLYFTYQAGNVIRLYPTFSASYTDIDAMTKDMKNRWTLPGDEYRTNIPTIASNAQLAANSDLVVAYNVYNFSDQRVAKGDFIRLKDITFTYDVKGNVLKTIGFKSLQLRGVVSNVWLIYSDKALNGQDPEFTRSGGVAMPMPRQFTLSVRAGL
ncbi:MAG: SusC/RagA family TonB-linked outer membrane protein [Dysgonomonas sp.]